MTAMHREESSLQFTGYFTREGKSQSECEWATLNRALLCFDFEDPKNYIEQVRAAERRRKKVVDLLQYEFFVDSMDYSGAPLPNKSLIANIKALIRHSISSEELSLPVACAHRIVAHYRRVMNELLFRHEVRIEGLDVYVPTKYKKAQASNKHVRRELKIKKDNKIIRLLPKSMEQKIADIAKKTIFVNHEMAALINDLRYKCQGAFMEVSMFSIEKGAVVELFAIDQSRSIANCYSAFNDFIIAPF